MALGSQAVGASGIAVDSYLVAVCFRGRLSRLLSHGQDPEQCAGFCLPACLPVLPPSKLGLVLVGVFMLLV